MRAKLVTEDGSDTLLWWCPGCDSIHGARVRGGGGPVWSWNGSEELPTIAPSFLAYEQIGGPQGERRTLCHCFVREGRVQFLPDSPHHLSGKTVDLPPWEAS